MTHDGNWAKIFLALSAKEGSYISIAESLFSGTPVGVYRDAVIGSKDYINEHTGTLLDSREPLAPQTVQSGEFVISALPSRHASIVGSAVDLHADSRPTEVRAVRSRVVDSEAQYGRSAEEALRQLGMLDYFAGRLHAAEVHFNVSPPDTVTLIAGPCAVETPEQTLGAVIRIREAFPTRSALFDIGVAGPIAGFVVAVPALFIGLMLSRVDRLPEDSSQLMELGEPLLFRFAAWVVWGDVAEGYSINMHPMAFAAWFGLLATALNLFPIGQLDGGHISYAVLGRRSTLVTLATVGALIGLTFVSMSWLVWTVLTVVMLVAFGPRHPRTMDEHIPLDRGRQRCGRRQRACAWLWRHAAARSSRVPRVTSRNSHPKKK